MTPLILALLAIVAVGAAGMALVPSMLGSSRADKRISALKGDIQANRREATASRDRDQRRKDIQQTLRTQTDLLEKRKKRVPLQDQIYQAGLKTKRGAFVRNQIIVGAVIFVVCFVLQVQLLFGLVFGVAGGYLLPRMYLGHRRKRFQAAYLDELPNAVEAIVRGVKSGLPLNDSMRVVAKEVKEPVKSEFQRVLDQQAIGKSMGEAVNVLYDRVPLPEVNFFIVVITVQQQAGGNLARVLRNRKKMKQKVKAMSSEAKASAGIVGSLPFIVALLVSLTTPGYLLPLVQTQIGMIWLGIAVILMGVGIFIMNRMVQFDF